MSYLQPIGALLNSDDVKYHRAAGTSELYGAVGDVEEILHLVEHQLRQITKGLDELPTESEGLRTDTMAGVLDPNETVGIAMDELRQSAELVGKAAGHARAALNQAARLYVDNPH